MLESRQWKMPAPEPTKPEPAMAFALDGDAVPASRCGARRTWIRSAEGVVARDERGVDRGARRLCLVSDGIVGGSSLSLRHSLPRTIDLAPLLGRRVRVTLVHAVASEGAVSQTLTVAGDDRRPHVIAHAGAVKGLVHTLGALSVYVALSQRPGGPMVFGTCHLQLLVRVGDHARLRDAEDDYVLELCSRAADGASYVIARDELWRRSPRLT